MEAGDVKPYFESLQVDLDATDDPQLRAWYETEVSLTPEHREATTLKEKLGQFHGLLSQTIERAEATEAAEVAGLLEIDRQQEADELSEIDEYVTPEEKKRRSVISWLDEVVDSYQQGREAAQAETKKSRRERQQELAARRFARNFERFGPAAEHIVHDPDALAIALEQLLLNRPALAEVVIKNCESYMHANGVEFAKNTNAFARLIQHSTDIVLGSSFDRVLSAIYEKVPYLQDPEQGVSLYVSLASAALETFDGKTHTFYHKVAETMDLKNDIIGPKSEYVAAIDGLAFLALGVEELLPLAGELWNARWVSSQFKQAFLNQPNRREAEIAKNEHLLTVGRSLGRKYGDINQLSQQHVDRRFFERSQHAEQFEIFDLKTGQPLPLSNEKIDIPEFLKPHFYSAELYAKRKERIAPRGLVHDIIRSTANKDLGVDPREINIADIPISPGLAISYGSNLVIEELLRVNDIVISKLLDEFGDQLRGGLFVGSQHEDIARFGHLRINLSDNRRLAFAEVFLRPAIPDDALLAGGPYTSLITSMRHDAREYTDAFKASERHDEKLAYIANNRNHYPGRRPVKFSLPAKFQDRGLQAVEVRQHPDRSHLYISAIHEEGRLEFVFDKDFRIDTNNTKILPKTALLLAFQDLVITLAAEWCCRPVVETSEGTVNANESSSKVNLGYLRYLPVGQNFSPRQRRIFASEQRGNLTAESLRRKAHDPTGSGRNSTYVKENYDPKKPPLEIYYDSDQLQQRLSSS